MSNIEEPEIIALIEGFYYDTERINAYETTANKYVFVVKWIRDQKLDSFCLPVYTLENKLLGFIRKDVDKIKQLFLEYSEPAVLLRNLDSGDIIIGMHFSHDKVYLENLIKRAHLMIARS